MTQAWKSEGTDDLEITRRLIDLFFVSVLLDAGAGDHWRYTEPGTGQVYERSEGIAVASLYMFKSLTFTDAKPAHGPKVYGNHALSIHVEHCTFVLMEMICREGVGRTYDRCTSFGISSLQRKPHGRS